VGEAGDEGGEENVPKGAILQDGQKEHPLPFS
jgi:hypothetical protein